MTYIILFSIVLGYLIIAFLVAMYLKQQFRKWVAPLKELGVEECKSIALGAFTAAILWPVWLVKVFILGYKYVTRGEGEGK